MAKQKVVTAPAVQLKTTSGQYVTLYSGAPVPENADKDHLKSLVDLKMVGDADEPAEQEPGDPSPTPGSVEAILAEVGDDQEKAKAALEAETGEGGKNRSTLVKKLEAIANPQA